MGAEERLGLVTLPRLPWRTLQTLRREAIRRGSSVRAVAAAILNEACELLRAREQGADRN